MDSEMPDSGGEKGFSHNHPEPWAQHQALEGGGEGFKTVRHSRGLMGAIIGSWFP
jgi:hypothetical protein